MNPGLEIRFAELYENDKPLIIAPIDDLLISGLIKGLENPKEKIEKIISSKPDAVLTFAGTVQKYPFLFKKQKFIINLSGSTTRSNYTRKVMLGSIETALRLNANAIAFHINVTSKYESEMLLDAGILIEQAKKYDMPVVGILYPRGEKEDGTVEEYEDLKKNDIDEYANLVAHCAQIGVDLGVDLIKTKYTGSTNSFQKVIRASQGTPIVVAGGPLIEENKAISNACEAVNSGAKGISYARNVFGRDNPSDFYQKFLNDIL